MKILLAFFLLLGIACNVNSQTSDKVEKLKANEYQKRLTEKNVQLIDVRTPEEFAQGHIEGAININYYDSNFKSQLVQLEKEKPVFIYCHSGGRSGKATNVFTELGFTKVIDLSGGITAWKNAGFKTIK